MINWLSNFLDEDKDLASAVKPGMDKIQGKVGLCSCFATHQIVANFCMQCNIDVYIVTHIAVHIAL